MNRAAKSDTTRLGLLAVILLLIAIFAIFRFALYTLERVYGITVPYPEITITLAWAIMGLVGAYILGRTIQATMAPLIGARGASTAHKVITGTLIFAILIATLANLHIDVTGYLVSLGVTAVVIGFAAQATIGNLISGVLVLISKPFRKGDYIRVNITGGPIEGTIDEISFLRSRIFTNDGVSISVPNTVMLAVPISNFTVFEHRPLILNISLERDISVADFKSKVESAMLTHGETMGEIRLYLKGLDQDATYMELWVQVGTHNFLKERSQIVHTIKEICEKENIALKKVELQS
jgi:small-conductance mechanosensitive channel